MSAPWERGAENQRPSGGVAQRARNPILEPDAERHNTRRIFQPAQSEEQPMFEGCHLGKGTIPKNCAGLQSARQGEILYSDVPPRKAHGAPAAGLAGLGSAEAFDSARGKMRPMTAASITNRNPLLLDKEVDGGAGGLGLKHRTIAPEVAAQFKGALGPGLLPAEGDGGETARFRRPATARAPGDDGTSVAGATSRMLHRFESADDPHGKAHTRTAPNGVADLINYRFAGGNSVRDSGSPVDTRAKERVWYEKELRKLHAERQADGLYEDARAGTAPSLSGN
jgi:hypothetical protein